MYLPKDKKEFIQRLQDVSQNIDSDISKLEDIVANPDNEGWFDAIQDVIRAYDNLELYIEDNKAS